MPRGICLIKMVFDYCINKSKWLVKNANLGLVKKYIAQSQWTCLKQFVQND